MTFNMDHAISGTQWVRNGPRIDPATVIPEIPVNQKPAPRGLAESTAPSLIAHGVCGEHVIIISTFISQTQRKKSHVYCLLLEVP